MSELAINKPIELIKGIIADMQVFREQVGDIEDMNKEIEKAKRELERLTHNNKLLGLEVAEKEAILKRMERVIDEHDRKIDAQREEIRNLTTQRDQIAAELQRLRQQFGG